jgi:hypothetical protein
MEIWRMRNKFPSCSDIWYFSPKLKHFSRNPRNVLSNFLWSFLSGAPKVRGPPVTGHPDTLPLRHCIWPYQTQCIQTVIKAVYGHVWHVLIGMKNYWTDGTKPKEWVDSSVCVCSCRPSCSNSWFQVTELIPFRNLYFMYFILMTKYT